MPLTSQSPYSPFTFPPCTRSFWTIRVSIAPISQARPVNKDSLINKWGPTQPVGGARPDSIFAATTVTTAMSPSSSPQRQICGYCWEDWLTLQGRTLHRPCLSSILRSPTLNERNNLFPLKEGVRVRLVTISVPWDGWTSVLLFCSLVLDRGFLSFIFS